MKVYGRTERKIKAKLKEIVFVGDAAAIRQVAKFFTHAVKEMEKFEKKKWPDVIFMKARKPESRKK